jgi:hypothetical protein
MHGANMFLRKMLTMKGKHIVIQAFSTGKLCIPTGHSGAAGFV